MSEPELNAALAAAQGEFPAITKSKVVKSGAYSYSYAPLDAILAAVKPALEKHGLAVVQLLDGPGLRTELRHKSGGVIGATFPFDAPAKAQELGSLVTYLRRYALSAILGIAAEDDDDGAQATAAKPAARKRTAAKPEADPLPPGPPDPGFYKPEPITKDQLTKIHTLFNVKGITDRDARLAFCTQALGRTITSSKDLGKAEATAVIKQLTDYDPENPQSYPFPEGF
jgi:hypothetical protein